MKTNTIAFTYNPYKYFESYKNVLNNVREHYPDSDVFIYMDNDRPDLQKYVDLASKYDCIIQIRNQKYDFINKEDSIETNSPKMLEWVDRIKTTCETTSADWVLNLEDDVIIKRSISQWPNAQIGTCRGYFRPGGGSIFSKMAFLNSINNTDLKSVIQNVRYADWAGDILLEHMFRMNGCTFEEWIELAEQDYRDDTDHAVYHGYKELHKLG
jgi:hypothetical protein